MPLGSGYVLVYTITRCLVRTPVGTQKLHDNMIHASKLVEHRQEGFLGNQRAFSCHRFLSPPSDLYVQQYHIALRIDTRYQSIWYVTNFFWRIQDVEESEDEGFLTRRPFSCIRKTSLQVDITRGENILVCLFLPRLVVHFYLFFLWVSRRKNSISQPRIGTDSIWRCDPMGT